MSFDKLVLVRWPEPSSVRYLPCIRMQMDKHGLAVKDPDILVGVVCDTTSQLGCTSTSCAALCGCL